jgi:hypothetical protein
MLLRQCFINLLPLGLHAAWQVRLQPVFALLLMRQWSLLQLRSWQLASPQPMRALQSTQCKNSHHS